MNRHEAAPQLPLDLNPAPVSLPRLNPSTDPATPERKMQLQAACWRALELLLQGPADAVALRSVAGWRYGARLNELRPWIAWKAGRAPYLAVFQGDPERNPIACDRASESNPVYVLAAWAVGPGRALLEQRPKPKARRVA